AEWTDRIQLGPMVSPMTFYEPAVLGRIALAVDELSEGRLLLGVGTGWYQAEHERMGIPFPSLRERFDRLEAGIPRIRSVLERRAAGLQEVLPDLGGMSPGEVVGTLRERKGRWFVGSPEEIVEQMREYVLVGVQLFMLQQYLLDDSEGLDLLAAEVMPALAS